MNAIGGSKCRVIADRGVARIQKEDSVDETNLYYSQTSMNKSCLMKPSKAWNKEQNFKLTTYRQHKFVFVELRICS